MNATTKEEDSEQPAQPDAASKPASSLPLFYKQPRPLDARVHGQVSLKREIDLGFARETNAIPLTGAEFVASACHYPIVFTTDPVSGAFAVVGLKPSRNLFVDLEGRWRTAYVPAYVRRYPFIFLELNKGEQLALCIDEAGGALEPGLARPLFEKGKQTEAVDTALQFCISYQSNHVATTAFVQALVAEDLLIERQANVALSSGEQVGMTGFKIVDEVRFAALGEPTLIEWHKRGWVGLIYAHLVSMGCWPRLVEMMGEKE